MLSTSPWAGGTPSLPAAGAPLPPARQARAFVGVWCPAGAAAHRLLAGPSWEGRAANTHLCRAAFGTPFIYTSFNRSNGREVGTVQPNHPSLQGSSPASGFPCPSAQQSVVQVLNEAEVGLGVGAGGKCTPRMIALHCTVTTKKKPEREGVH